MRQLEKAVPALYNELTRALGEDSVTADEKALRNYHFDALRPYRAFRHVPRQGFKPQLGVIPFSTEEVSQVVKLAAKHVVPLVPRGGGTGLMGGAVAIRGGIVIDMKKMDNVIAADPVNRQVVVQAGATLEAVDGILREKGLMLGHDPWTKTYATVGGSIATGGLGYLGGRYGGIGDQVLGLEVVLPDGRIIRVRPVARSSTGLDLKHLFIGTEGTLGIITEADLRVFPRPEEERVYAYGFKSFADAYAAILEMWSIGLNPTSIDCGSSAPGEPSEMYFVLSGLREEVQGQEKRATAIIRKHRGLCMGEREAQKYWQGRYDIAHRYAQSTLAEPLGYRRRDKSFDFVHVALPANRVLEYWDTCQRIAEEQRVEIVSYGIWVGPELFSLAFSTDDGVPPENLETAVSETLELALELGGSMEYCHGVGIRLARLMRRQHGLGLDLMKKIKATLDPLNLMNPGKLDL